MSARVAVRTDTAPQPAGTYSQAIRAGDLVWVAGQTPRRPDGGPIAEDFAEQAHQTMRNLRAVAEAAGCSLADAVKVTVYLRDPALRHAFDAIYREYVASPPPARALVQSGLPGFELEIDAVLFAPAPT